MVAFARLASRVFRFISDQLSSELAESALIFSSDSRSLVSRNSQQEEQKRPLSRGILWI